MELINTEQDMTFLHLTKNQLLSIYYNLQLRIPFLLHFLHYDFS